MANKEDLMAEFKWFVENMLMWEHNLGIHRRKLLESGFTEDQIRAAEENMKDRFTSGRLFEDHTCPIPSMDEA